MAARKWKRVAAAKRKDGEYVAAVKELQNLSAARGEVEPEEYKIQLKACWKRTRKAKRKKQWMEKLMNSQKKPAIQFQTFESLGTLGTLMSVYGDDQPDEQDLSDEIRNSDREVNRNIDDTRHELQDSIRNGNIDDTRDELQDSIQNGNREVNRNIDDTRDELQDSIRNGNREVNRNIDDKRDELQDSIRNNSREINRNIDDTRHQLQASIWNSNREVNRNIGVLRKLMEDLVEYHTSARKRLVPLSIADNTACQKFCQLPELEPVSP